ncbi:cytochrome c oxidase accessory protein CcoG [Aestuariibius sp. 2305UL40-4]|uniref:cytochrome c oxidase accessory protein CcoG n=1 Tax=Aestuariibius violaceus TaxID=3234132 RepID=UPI00345EBA36
MSESTSLYAPRVPIFPRRVSGPFRRLKWWILIVTLGIYYVTPWLRWDRGPSLPDQAVLVDLANRRFYFFWIEIWPHEFYFVAGLLIMAGLGLFLFTAALGRVWCGYACPQTVWTDLFILVERWIEGDRNARIRLHDAPWTVRKWRLRVTKWTVWLLIGLATGGAWVFYFTDAPALARDLATFSAPPVAYITIAILTATTFVFGGFMREQVCIYMCPWPRIQGAMMDEDTLTVGYRDWRGEPRGKGTKRRKEVAEAVPGGADAVARYGKAVERQGEAPRISASGEELGDCIDCNACVAVCPMGIDIRDGQQMECITCALCIDACDDVMAKIGKPRGLIDYLALSDAPNEIAGEPPKAAWTHVVKPRNILYTTLWSGIGVALVFALFIRPEIEMTVAPIRNPQFVTLADGTIRNLYDVRLRNKHGDDRRFRLSIATEEDLRIALEGTETLFVEVPANTQRLQRVYVSARPGSDAAQQHASDFRFWVEDVQSGERAHRDSTFNGRDLP